MNEKICPGCGSPYNGRKCSCCFYENPADQSSRSVVDSVRSFLKAHRHFIRALLGFAVLLILIGFLMPVLRDFGLRLDSFG